MFFPLLENACSLELPIPIETAFGEENKLTKLVGLIRVTGEAVTEADVCCRPRHRHPCRASGVAGESQQASCHVHRPENT